MLNLAASILASVVGAVGTHIAIDMWRSHSRKPLQTGAAQTGAALSIDLNQLRKVVAAVPFYGPPAAAALDAVNETARQQAARPSKGRSKPMLSVPPVPLPPVPVPPIPTPPVPVLIPVPPVPVRPVDLELAQKVVAAIPGCGPAAAAALALLKHPNPDPQEASTQAKDDPMTNPIREAISVAGADPEVGAAMAPTPPRVDYIVRDKSTGRPRVDKAKRKAWDEKYKAYRVALQDYNAARAFDAQIARQKKELKEQIRRAKSGNEVIALKQRLNTVKKIGQMSIPANRRNVYLNPAAKQLYSQVIRGQFPQVTDPAAFNTFLQQITGQPAAAAVPGVDVPAVPGTGPVPAQPAAPFASPPGLPTAPPAQLDEEEEMDPRLGPMDDEDEEGAEALLDQGYGVVDLQGAGCDCGGSCGGTCAACSIETGCASCGDVDDELEGKFDPEDDDDFQGGKEYGRRTSFLKHHGHRPPRTAGELDDELDDELDGADDELDDDDELDGADDELDDDELDGADDELDGYDDELDGADDELDGYDDELDGYDDELDGADDELDGYDDELDGYDDEDA